MTLRKAIAVLMVALLCAACAFSAPQSESQMSDHFHWLPATDAKGWVVALPGAGGLRVLDDDRHYFDFAERFNQLGWSVLLVDYRPAYRASSDRPDGSAGEKIAWVTEQAVAWMHRAHPGAASIPGAVVGWSRGGEGVLTIVNDVARASALGIAAAAVYYPSIEWGMTLSNHVPILFLSGQDDDVTRVGDVEALVQNRSSDAGVVTLHIYPGAHHGFDVASLTERRTIRLLPLIGPRATLQFDEASAADAEKRLLAFLDDHAVQRTFPTTR